MIFAGLELAQRVESAEAHNGVACAEAQQRLNPGLGAAVMELSGGSAIFVGAESPLTRAVGMGMRGPVTEEETGRLEEFYGMRGAAVNVDLCPLADASLLELLGARGYRPAEFNNVLVRVLRGTAVGPPEPSVRMANEDEEHLWALTVGRGFLEKDDLTAEEMEVGLTIWHMAGSRCYFALNGEQIAGAGAMVLESGLATLFADSTTTAFRGKGLQAALIRERLRIAAGEGCDLATAATLPGSASQRNYERNGCQVVYTRALLVR